jgi:hypothetical protein
MGIDTVRSIIFVALAAHAAIPARAQSLAEVARQEGARRNATVSTGRIYTNSDLPPAPPPTEPVSEPGGNPPREQSARASAEPASGNELGPDALTPDALHPDQTASPDGAQSLPDRGEDYWRKRMSDIRTQLDRDTSYAEAMKARVDVLGLDYISSSEVGQRLRVGIDRQKALTELELLTKAVEDGKKAIVDLEEEARQAGALQGWLH